MNINITVRGQVLSCPSDLKITMVEGSKEFIHFIFDLDQDWDKLTVCAQFIQDDMGYNVYLDKRDTVSIPQEIEQGSFYVVLYGVGDEEIVATSTGLKFTMTGNMFISDGQSIDITPSLYEQIVERVEDVEDLVDSIKSAKIFYGYCSTQSDQPIKIVDCPDYVPTEGTFVCVTFEWGNTDLSNPMWLSFDNGLHVRGIYYLTRKGYIRNKIPLARNQSVLFRLESNTFTVISISQIPDFTPNRVAITDEYGMESLSSITSEELGYLTGLDDNIKDQFTAVKTDIGPLNKLKTTEKTNLVAAVNEVNRGVNNKADTSGVYPKFTSGTAFQLLSDKVVNNKGAFNFRQAPVPNGRATMKAVGGSVVWNQLLEPITGSAITVNGVTITPNGDGSVTLNNTSTNSGVLLSIGSFQQITGHNYLLIVHGSVNSNGYTNIGGLSREYSECIVKSITTGAATISLRTNNNETYSNNKMWFTAFDLTAMFGPTIADYIYSLEQATAGAGVAWFRRYFPKSYYAYNPGSIESTAFGHYKSVGFNLFDINSLTTDDFMAQYASDFYPLGEYGSFSVSNGELLLTRNSTSTAVFLCLGKCYKGVPMCVSFNCKSGEIYDIDARTEPPTSLPDNSKRFYRETFLAGTTRINHTFTPSQDGYVYIEYFGNSALSETISNLNYNYSDPAKNGTYEPYVCYTYHINKILSGISKLDSNNNLVFDGDTKTSDGVVTRNRKKIVIDGTNVTFTNAFGATSNGYAVYMGLADYSKGEGTVSVITSAICDKFTQSAKTYTAMEAMTFISSSGAATTMIFILPSSVTSLAEANTWASNNPITVEYRLATPTTEQVTGWAEPINVGVTEEFTDYVERDVTIPCGIDADYHTDLKGKLEDMPNLPTENGTYGIKVLNGVVSFVQLS